MRERDIVDFTKFEKNDDDFIDDNGNLIGCEICYTHEKAYEHFGDDEKLENMDKIPIPRCPVCGKHLVRRLNFTTMAGNAVVGETNYQDPDANIGFYSIWECEDCMDKYDHNQIFALMPIPIGWNANHDIYYTGGKEFSESKDLDELIKLIKLKVMPSIMNYVRRVLRPENVIDKNLNENNLNWWCSGDIEHAVAEWMYNHGWKK